MNSKTELAVDLISKFNEAIEIAWTKANGDLKKFNLEIYDMISQCKLQDSRDVILMLLENFIDRKIKEETVEKIDLLFSKIESAIVSGRECDVVTSMRIWTSMLEKYKNSNILDYFIANLPYKSHEQFARFIVFPSCFKANLHLLENCVICFPKAGIHVSTKMKRLQN